MSYISLSKYRGLHYFPITHTIFYKKILYFLYYLSLWNLKQGKCYKFTNANKGKNYTINVGPY